MNHQPVLLNEVLNFWYRKGKRFYVDCTVGMGGHTEALLNQDPETQCLALDRDMNAIKIAEERLKKFGKRVLLRHENYIHLPEVLMKENWPMPDGILLDLGVSSLQLDDPERGFSFRNQGPLDMRMNPIHGETALDLIQRSTWQELSQILYNFGEEKNAQRIARSLKNAQEQNKLKTTLDASIIISKAIGGGRMHHGKISPATKSFQALRIAVNHELDHLQHFIHLVPQLLAQNGRVCFISFHSLEDRIVKTTFKKESLSCICPADFPKCICQKTKTLNILTSKAVRSSEEEISKNPRSRSARLRVAEKC